MRAIKHFRRSASSAVLLGRSSEQSGRHDEGEAAEMQDRAGVGGGEEQTPLDKTLTKIGFGTYQKKLL